MKKTLSGLLSLALAAMLTFATTSALTRGADQKQIPASQRLSERASQEITGAGSWSEFTNGLACGLGIVGIAAGGLTGVGALAATVAVASVAGACVGACE